MPPYVPVDEFTVLDDDQSSEPIRNYPADKAEYMLNVFPDSLDFAETKAGEQSSPVPLVLINTGYSPLVINSVEVVGDFELVGNYPLILQPDQAMSISVRFIPRLRGAFTGGVFIDTGDAAGTEFIRLTGIGSSSYVADLNTDIIRAVNTGLGTTSAIQATTQEVVPLATAAKLIALDITVNNVGSTTVQFNANTPLTILEQDGSALENGDLVAGTMVLGYITGSNFRLLTDNTVAAALAMLYELKDDAENAAANAEADRLSIQQTISGFMAFSSTIDLPNIPANSRAEVTVTATDAVLGDVFIGASAAINTGGLVFNGYVSAANTVKLIISNVTGADIDLASTTIKIKLQR